MTRICYLGSRGSGELVPRSERTQKVVQPLGQGSEFVPTPGRTWRWCTATERAPRGIEAEEAGAPMDVSPMRSALREKVELSPVAVI